MYSLIYCNIKFLISSSSNYNIDSFSIIFLKNFNYWFFFCLNYQINVYILFFPGASDSDYIVDSEFLKLGVEADQSEAQDDSKSSDCVSSIGNVTFVSCSTGPSSPPSPAEEDKGMTINFYLLLMKYNNVLLSQILLAHCNISSYLIKILILI